MPDSRRHSFGPALLGGGALLLVAGLVLGFVPLVDCPRCTEWDFFGPFEIWDVHKLSKPCRVCGGRRSVSLLKKWHNKSTQAAR
jgi:hypothetical protein